MPSGYHRITAMFPMERLERVKSALQKARVRGLSVSEVKGYGEYRDYFARDWLDVHARVEILIGTERCQEIVDALLEAASTGSVGDGILSVMPVESVWRIRSRARVDPTEL